MTHIRISAIAIGMSTAMLANAASAQTVLSNKQRGKTYEESRSRLKVNRPNSGSLDDLGYVVSDGIIISPTVRAETGYDSNVDNLFSEPSSAYGIIDGSVVLGFVKPNQATTIALKGKRVQFEGLDRNERWDAGISLDTYKKLASGLEISAGALHLHDAVSYTTNESTAAYYKLQYQNHFLETYASGVTNQIRYLSQQDIPSSVSATDRPFYFNSEYNHHRSEQTAGLLIHRNSMFSPYVEGGFASINYIDQKIAATVNRDAREYWGIAGVRINLIPQVRADIGYRYSRRDLDDTTVRRYDTDYLDARISWAPTNNFRASFEVDHKLGEASAAQSRLTEVTTHSILMQYKATPRTQLTVRAYQKRSTDIGDITSFRERGYQSETTYDINNKTQFYFNSLWSQVKEEASQTGFEHVKIGLGIRVKYNGADSQPWNSVWDEIKALPLERKLITTEIAYNHMVLPSMDMFAITDPFLTRTSAHGENHDGHVDGYKISVNLGEMAAPGQYDASTQKLVLKGFYGHYSTKDTTSCNYTLAFDCVFINITDANIGDDNNTGAFGRLLSTTKRAVDHWGISVEAPILRALTTGSINGGNSPKIKSPWKFGLAVKGIEEKTDLFAIDTSVPDPVDYDETLSTHYWGVFASYQKRHQLRQDIHLDLTAEGGLYYADTDYKGIYLAYYPVGGSVYALDRGRAEDSYQQEAFIGSLSMDLVKDMGWGNFSLTGQAEYYSYAPKMQYNDDDKAGGGVLDIKGKDKGTSIGDGYAFSFSVGGRVNIPLNNIIQ